MNNDSTYINIFAQIGEKELDLAYSFNMKSIYKLFIQTTTNNSRDCCFVVNRVGEKVDITQSPPAVSMCNYPTLRIDDSW